MAGILADATITWDDIAAAGATVLVALAIAWLVNRVMKRTEQRLAARRGAGALDPAGQTALRFLRRLVFAVILGGGIFLALLQFDNFDRIAGATLASSAVLAAILGFAAREALSNVIAGIMIALTQPIRVGDEIEIGDVRGAVDDVTLTYTWVRSADGSRHALPNQLLTTQPLRNDSIRGDAVVPSATVWIAPQADEGSALRVLLGISGASAAAVDEATPDGIRLRVSADRVASARRAVEEARLRAAALAALREAGIPPASAS